MECVINYYLFDNVLFMGRFFLKNTSANVINIIKDIKNPFFCAIKCHFFAQKDSFLLHKKRNKFLKGNVSKNLFRIYFFLMKEEVSKLLSSLLLQCFSNN